MPIIPYIFYVILSCMALDNTVHAGPLIVSNTPMTPSYAFGCNASLPEMARIFNKTNGANFETIVGVANSVALCITEGDYEQVADAVWLAQKEYSNFSNLVIYQVSGLVGKGVFDNLLLDRALDQTMDFVQYLVNLGRGAPVQPNAHMPVTWSHAVLYLMDRNNTQQAAKVLLAAAGADRNTTGHILEALNVAVLSQGCPYVLPVLQEVKRASPTNGQSGSSVAAQNTGTSSSTSNSSSTGNTLNDMIQKYGPLSTCYNTQAFPGLPGVDYSVDFLLEDLPKAKAWHQAIMDATPQGLGIKEYANLSSTLVQGMQFGIAYHASHVLVNTLVQGGAVAEAARKDVSSTYNRLGCQPIAVTLNDAWQIARATGVAATFLAELQKDPRFLDCLTKGLLAFQFQ